MANYEVRHSKNEFVNNHINSIKNFCRYAKCRLAKFKCIKKENFLFHLKECEFRYNTKTMQKLILKTIEINKKQKDEVIDKNV